MNVIISEMLRDEIRNKLWTSILKKYPNSWVFVGNNVLGNVSTIVWFNIFTILKEESENIIWKKY